MVVFVVLFGSAVRGQFFVPGRLTDETTKAAQGLYIPTPLANAHKRHLLPLRTNRKQGIMTVGANIFAVWERLVLLHRDVRGCSLSRPAFFCYLTYHFTI